MPDLETITLEAVEILSIGGPVFGKGSPSKGDFWTTDDLRQMADAAQELEAAGEWKIAARANSQPLGLNKVGHDPKQQLLAAEPTDGEMPAAGWITNQRVSDDGTKLLADITDVPKKLGDLIKAKAYRTRSSELSSITSQVTGKTYDWVVSGLAWLGGKMPAVRTLDDVVALYESEALAKPDARVFVVYAEGDIIWEPEAGFQDLLSDINGALNPGPGSSSYWASDVSVDRTKAIVQDYDAGRAWVVPITVGADGEPTVSPSSDWTEAEQAWVQAARDFEDAFADGSDRSRRHSPRMPEKTYTDEQRKAFAKAYETLSGQALDSFDKVTDEMLEKAGVPAAEDPEAKPARDLEDGERFRTLEQRVEDGEKKRRDLETQLQTERRDTWLEHEVLRAGKATPGQRDEIVAMYEEAPEHTRKFFASAPVNEEWAREYGADSDELLDDDALEAQNKAYEAETAVRLGIPAEQVI